MPKPSTQQELLAAISKERQALEKQLAGLTPEQMTQPGVMAEWSIKDILAHLVEWQQMVLRWVAAGRRGEAVRAPSEKYNWGQLPALNQEIFERYLTQPLDEVLHAYAASHQEMLDLIDHTPEDQLFTPGLYPWMNKNTLAAYINSSTAAHYRWARTEIRKGIKKS
ncbi:MAG TPA: ClbS/DfsB family four-helix bundle protein [Anaerolineales bacterium]|nr:ClbS/DfsB family four-helix bundle protein [Anaerolineales bacterium]